jgi:nucleotide-binding universal stress UspA family protein
MFRHVVVGCDGSAEGRDAVALGARIASAASAGLSLVGVFPTSLFPVPGLSDRRTMRSQTEKALRAERRSVAPQAMVHAVADVSVPRALQHQAERWHADLVVIGSAPDAPAGHTMIGRRGRQLLHNAPFALAVAQRGLHERDLALRSIGVGYDAWPESEVALAVAAALARSAGAKLSVLSVVEDRVPPLTAKEWLALKDWSSVWAAAREDALVRAESAAVALDIPTDVNAVVGDPGLRLRALSETVDLLVVGSRRWGPLARLVSGSVGETLVADSSCSVLIVPRTAKQPRRRARPQPATS